MASHQKLVFLTSGFGFLRAVSSAYLKVVKLGETLFSGSRNLDILEAHWAL
jgi:hypothetical protein